MSDSNNSLETQVSDSQTRRQLSGLRGSRRQMLQTLGAVGATSMLAGCIGDDSGGSSGDGGSPDMPDEITIIQENVPDTAAIEPLLDQFEEETGITATFTKSSYETLQDKIPTQLQSQDPEFDVAIYDIYWLGDFADGGLIRDLGDRVDDSDVIDPDNYFDPVWNGVATYDDRIWAVPFFHYAHSMIYRTDILEDPELEEAWDGDLSRPETVEEYVEMSKFLTSEKEDFHGAAMQGQRGVPINDEYMNYFQGLGGTFVEPDGTVKVDEHEDTAVDALELYIDNMENGAPEAAKSWKFSQSMEVLGAGDVFSMLTYHILFPVLANNSDVGDKLGFAPTVGGSAPLGGWSWGIPENVDEGRAEAAWKFIEWVESFETRKERMLQGGSPTGGDVLEDDEVIDSYPEFYSQQEEIITDAKPFPNVPGTTQAVQNWGTQMSLAVIGEKSPEDAVADGIDEVKNAIE